MRLTASRSRLSALKPARRWHEPVADPPGPDGLVLLRPPREGHVHLGCGDAYMRGYLNVDLPPAAGVASGTSRPDLEADVFMVDCRPGTLTEVRSHHMFEHFERAEALALLLRWHRWLRPGGYVTIETPDFDACIAGFAERSFAEQSLLLRHIFGSQEAPWARHLDGWSSGRFHHVLADLGFIGVSTSPTFSDAGKLLANVIVTARRAPDGGPSLQQQHERALEILRLSMNGQNATEEQLFERWRARFEELAPRPD